MQVFFSAVAVAAVATAVAAVVFAAAAAAVVFAAAAAAVVFAAAAAAVLAVYSFSYTTLFSIANPLATSNQIALY